MQAFALRLRELGVGDHPKPATNDQLKTGHHGEGRDVDAEKGMWSLRGNGQRLGRRETGQILALGRLGWSLRRIERELNVRRETAGAYLHAAGIVVRRAGGRVSRWPPVPDAGAETEKPGTTREVITDFGDSKPATTEGVITDSAPRQACRAPSASACEPYRDLIEQALWLGWNAMAIYQDLVTDHGFARYNSVRPFAIKVRGEQVPEPHPVIITEPGQEAQVDYGEGPMVRDAQTGKYRRARLFVLTLG